jgi:cholesterol oxidase
LNYLHVAETRYGAVIASEQKVYRIAALDALGEENSAMHGEHGYAVSVYNIRTGETKVWHAKRVIMAAGTLNTNELLLQARDRDLTLPHLSAALGQSFSGNGDFLAFVMNGQDPVDPNYGPVITQRIDFNLFDQQQPEHAFIMEDAAYPAMVAWYLEGQKPLFMKWGAISAFLHRIWDGVRRRQGVHHSGRFLAELFRFDMSYRSSVHLCMGLDRSDGVMSLDERRALSLHWPYQNSMSLYEAIIRSVKEFGRWSQGESSFALPTWYLKRNVSVHPLGGCRVGESPETSVTAATPASFGQVHNYQNLYVADGSLLPTAVGANPSATIAAMAERVAEGLTGIKPDANL